MGCSSFVHAGLATGLRISKYSSPNCGFSIYGITDAITVIFNVLYESICARSFSSRLLLERERLANSLGLAITDDDIMPSGLDRETISFEIHQAFVSWFVSQRILAVIAEPGTETAKTIIEMKYGLLVPVSLLGWSTARRSDQITCESVRCIFILHADFLSSLVSRFL